MKFFLIISILFKLTDIQIELEVQTITLDV